MLVAAGCDGYLGVWDLRKKGLFALSDNLEEEIHSISLQKNGKKVIASSSEGIINLFSWGDFGDCNDRIPGHPGSIDWMIKYDEYIVITGCEDGILRAVSILPNKVIFILGDPLDAEDEVFGITKISLSHDRMLVASTTLDDTVKLIDISNLKQR